MSTSALGTSMALIALCLAGCSDSQSVLYPLGPDAADIATLGKVLFAGGTAILMVMIALTAIALRGPDGLRRVLSHQRAIIAGGVAFPFLTLTALLVYGTLVTKASIAKSDNPGALQIAVEGRQWWWRITYTAPNGATFETANELRIPVNSEVALSLTSADVIHSFWVPNLAGKVDLIPGRTTRLQFSASQPGVARGQCAEFCGGPHALMALRAVVMEAADFEQWFDKERREATSATAGGKIFIAAGCGACHTVRGGAAAGRIGPDLTHVGGRLSLAADTLTASKDNFSRWITDNQILKPGNHMPAFRNLSASDLDDLTTYLESLK